MVEISGQINQTVWNLFSDGNLTIRFYANDSSGNLIWKEITVIKDATSPNISILNCFNLVEYNEREDNYRIRIWDLVGIDDDEYVDLQILRT